MLEMAAKPHIAGLTTNPTLMRKAGITDYRAFARKLLAPIPDKPITFEVFSDDFAEMERQANEIRSWGDNVYVKIPVTNTPARTGLRAGPRLARRPGVKQNVTALMTLAAGARGRRGAGRRCRPPTSPSSPGESPTPAAIRVPMMADGACDTPALPEPGTDLGQPARAAEHLPGRRDRLPRHHRHQRRAEEAGAGRQGPGRIFAGNRQDVPRRREGRRLSRFRVRHIDPGWSMSN